MSHEATNWAFKQRGLKPAAWRVLAVLADRHNPDLGCFPSQSQLAFDAEMSVASLNNQLAYLEDLGLVRRVRRINPETRKQMSTRYILGFEGGEAQVPTPENGDGKPEKPTPKKAESRLQNLETNPVREPISIIPAKSASADRQDRCLAAAGVGISKFARKSILRTAEVIDGWIETGLDLDLDILPVIAEMTKAPRKTAIRSWDYFSVPIKKANAKRLGSNAEPCASGKRGKIAESSDALLVPGSPEDRAALEGLAAWINSGRFIPSSAVRNTQRDRMLEAGLVTRERLREIGVY
jgi:endonuclease YncB( thermonuclease family)